MFKTRLLKAFVISMILIVAIALSIAAISLFKIFPYFQQEMDPDDFSLADGESFSILFVITSDTSDGKLVLKSGYVLYGVLMDPLTLVVEPLGSEKEFSSSHLFSSEKKLAMFINQTEDIPYSHYILVDDTFIEKYYSLYEYHKNSSNEPREENLCEILLTLTDEDLVLLSDEFPTSGYSDLSLNELLKLWDQLKHKTDCLYEGAS